MAQFNPEALNYPFGGLNIIFCGDFSQLNPVGKKDIIYDQSRNALWGMINRVVNLTMTNWRFLKDPQWGNLLQRMHHGETRWDDIKLINSRVIGENLTLPSFDELQGSDVSYACYTNSDRNVISDIILQLFLKNDIKRNMRHLRFLNRPLLSKVILATLKQMNQNHVHIINLFKVNVEMTMYKVEMVKISLGLIHV
jgi:hypothetical protein